MSPTLWPPGASRPSGGGGRGESAVCVTRRGWDDGITRGGWWGRPVLVDGARAGGLGLGASWRDEPRSHHTVGRHSAASSGSC